MKKITVIAAALICSALTLGISACGQKISLVEFDPFMADSNYRDLRIKGYGYSGEQFTEHTKVVKVGNEEVVKKNYVVEEVKALVVPVDFTDAPYTWYGDTEEGTRAELQKVFFGGPEDMEWYSLAEYYKQSSFNQCHISGQVIDWWHTGVSYKSLPKDTETGKASTSYARNLAIEIQDRYRDDPTINLADYDANKDGFVDTIIMIYTAPIETTGSLWWAFCSSVGNAFGKYTADGSMEGANRFFWASYRFLYERWNQQSGEEAQYTSAEIKAGVDAHGNPIHPDAHTMTHEFGHCLSLPDYYITDYDTSDYGAMGGLDMMDYNVGDHNAYSKMCYGWINPKRVAGTTGSITVTMNSTTTTGDAIIIPAPGEWHNTLMDQYLVIEFLTPEGVAKADSEQRYLGHYPLYYNRAGVRILHIDSRMGLYQYSGAGEQAGYKFAGYTWSTSSAADQTYVRVAADNTKSRSCFPKYKLAEVMPSNGKSIKTFAGSQADASCLYYEGDSFGFKGQAWGDFKLNGINGEANKTFGFKIRVNKIDGNKSATITISR